MGKYVMVHPAVEQPVAADFENVEGQEWSHVIKDEVGDRLLFGDFYSAHFDFECFRLLAGDESSYRKFSWAQAREFAETIIALADKYEGAASSTPWLKEEG